MNDIELIETQIFNS